jgi:hypothetical protein
MGLPVRVVAVAVAVAVAVVVVAVAVALGRAPGIRSSGLRTPRPPRLRTWV